MPKSALPVHLNDPEEINAAFPDDSDNGSLWRRFKKATKTWFAFGPRCHERWARFREWPVTLFAAGNDTYWRYEDDKRIWLTAGKKILWLCKDDFSSLVRWYLSRVQYGKKWHVQIQWPLFFEVQVGSWQFYTGFKRDADKVYWLALYLGRVWK